MHEDVMQAGFREFEAAQGNLMVKAVPEYVLGIYLLLDLNQPQAGITVSAPGATLCIAVNRYHAGQLKYRTCLLYTSDAADE